MKISRFATAFVLAVGLSIPQTGAQATLSGQGSEQPTRELAVRDVYSCPAPEDVQGEAKWKINNTTGLALTVYVSDDKGNAYQVLERVGTPAVREWNPQLEDGTYHLTCVFHNDSAVESEDFTVTGSTVRNAPKMVPITDHEVAAVSIKQAEEQEKRVPELQKRAHALADATASSRPAAQAAYLATTGQRQCTIRIFYQQFIFQSFKGLLCNCFVFCIDISFIHCFCISIHTLGGYGCFGKITFTLGLVYYLIP